MNAMSSTLHARMAALADELANDPGHDDGYMAAADRIREELAAETPADVWAVHATDYDDNGTRALFTTQALAEAHRDQLNTKSPGSYAVEGFDLLDRLPKLLQLSRHHARVFPDGTVEHGDRTTHREEWDYYQTGNPVSTHLWGTATDIGVESEDPVPLLREQIEATIREFAAAQNWTQEQLAEAIASAWPPRATRLPDGAEQYCYDASFGRVHFSASCRCVRS
jgi:hypothetical protein